MNTKHKTFFKNLVTSYSPSGYEKPAQKIYYDYVKQFADKVEADVNGNVIAHKKGKGKFSVMLVGHADEIGLMVSHITEDGYIYCKSIGGMDASILPALRMNIHHEGKIVRAVAGRKAAHMVRGDDSPKIKLDDIWFDIGAKDKKDALKRVSLGDIVTYSADFERINGDFYATKATDNKAGVFVAAVALELLKDEKIYADIYSVASVKEEIGGIGAKTSSYSINPDLAVVFDVTFTSDHPGVDKKVYGDIALGDGPVVCLGANINDKALALLKETAEECKIPLQWEVSTMRTGTDLDSIFSNRSGIPSILISIPNRYMHSPNEMISLKDLESTAKLTAEFLKRIDAKFDLYPFKF
ncbi:MAG: M42 family metallopeptidase [Candidatus Zophobacter franzmannii]|nr:M42 family metallopeptidase [Candidatus Zophobacter franzmannii]